MLVVRVEHAEQVEQVGLEVEVVVEIVASSLAVLEAPLDQSCFDVSEPVVPVVLVELAGPVGLVVSSVR